MKSELKHTPKAHYAPETPWKEKLKTNSLFGTIIDVGKFYKRAIKKFSIKTSQAPIADFTTYEISMEHKNHMEEFELQRAQAVAEAYRQRLRLL